MFELDGEYFSEKVTREFGENLVVTGVGLTVVFPLNDYVRKHGRNLTTFAVDEKQREGCWDNGFHRTFIVDDDVACVVFRH